MTENSVERLRRRLQTAIKDLPKGFFNSFDFIRGRKNLCHPIGVGLIARVLGELDGISYVGFDVRLNDGKGHKFQPDLVGYIDVEGTPVMFVDFESPNSSDTRIPRYHIQQYLQWVKHFETRPPYVIVTCLPDTSAPKWKQLYKSGRLHSYHRVKDIEKLRASPFRYWVKVWGEDLRKSGESLSGISFLNIDDHRVISFDPLQRQ
jgi:hypothetical protein